MKLSCFSCHIEIIDTPRVTLLWWISIVLLPNHHFLLYKMYKTCCGIVRNIYHKFWISWNTIAISFRILRNTIARGRQGRQRAYIVGIDIVLYYCLKCSNELRMKPFSNVRKFLRFDKITLNSKPFFLAQGKQRVYSRFWHCSILLFKV